MMKKEEISKIVNKIDDKFNNMCENARELEQDICDLLVANGKTIMNVSRIFSDPIFAYLYDEYFQLQELEVKGIEVVTHNSNNKVVRQLYVLLDTHEVVYSDKDVEEIFESGMSDQIYALFGGDLLGVFTIYNIAEELRFWDIEHNYNIERKKLTIADKTITIETGHLYSQWYKQYSTEYWNFPLSQLIENSNHFQVNEYMVYWLIGDRLYETDMEVE